MGGLVAPPVLQLFQPSQVLRVMANPPTHAGFFRCPVPPEKSVAHIRIGRRRVRVTMQEQSIDGFTIVLPAGGAKRLKVGRLWVLHYDGQVTEVHPEWLFHRPGGQVQLGLRRLRDLTPLPRMPFASFPGLRSLRVKLFGFPEFWLGTAVSALILLTSLPGVGDALGTAPRIREGVRTLVQNFDGMVRRFW